MRVTLRVTSIALLGYSSDQGLTATNMTIPPNIQWYSDIYGVSGTTGLVSVVVGHYWIGLGEGRIGFGLVSRGRGHYWIRRIHFERNATSLDASAIGLDTLSGR